MRVNLVSSHRNQTGLAQDVDILQGMWHLADETVKFRRILHVQPECEEAEINADSGRFKPVNGSQKGARSASGYKSYLSRFRPRLSPKL